MFLVLPLALRIVSGTQDLIRLRSTFQQTAVLLHNPYSLENIWRFIADALLLTREVQVNIISELVEIYIFIAGHLIYQDYLTETKIRQEAKLCI